MLSREILNRPSLVIIIDCLNDRQSSQYLSTLNNIKSFCETDPNVHAIGLASYIGMNQDCVAREEPWWSGGANFFHDTTRWETLRKTWEKVSFVNNQVTHQ